MVVALQQGYHQAVQELKVVYSRLCCFFDLKRRKGRVVRKLQNFRVDDFCQDASVNAADSRHQPCAGPWPSIIYGSRKKKNWSKAGRPRRLMYTCFDNQGFCNAETHCYAKVSSCFRGTSKRTAPLRPCLRLSQRPRRISLPVPATTHKP